MHAPGKDTAPDDEKNHFGAARIAVIGLVARTGEICA